MAKLEAGLRSTPLSKVSKFLQENGRIEMRHRFYVNERRYVRLDLQTIFDQLVLLFTPLIFHCMWKRFKWLMELYPPLSGVRPETHVARAYISAWIHDLYVSNREFSQTTLSYSDIENHYSHNEPFYSLEYDAFLIRLNEAIRPTEIKGPMENTLYIPFLIDCAAWETKNPFHIDNFVLNFQFLRVIIENLRESWRMSTIVSRNNNLGRPFWLFDWHKDKCYSWFLAEGNYTVDDISIAYIVGAACTPALGPRDIDDWQSGFVPENFNAKAYDRVKDRRFYGNYDVRTRERRQILPTAVDKPTHDSANHKRKKTAESTTSPSNAAIQTGTEFSEATASYPVPVNRLDLLSTCCAAHSSRAKVPCSKDDGRRSGFAILVCSFMLASMLMNNLVMYMLPPRLHLIW